MFDQFSYGYLGFALGPDGRTIHYLTGGPVYVDGRRVAGKAKTAMGESKGMENLHLVTYDIPAGKYTDHGPIFFENGQRPLLRELDRRRQGRHRVHPVEDHGETAAPEPT